MATLNASASLINHSPTSVGGAQKALMRFGFEVTRVSKNKDSVTVRCEKDKFEEVFCTKIERVPTHQDKNGFTPAYFRALEPIIIPKSLQKHIWAVSIYTPPTYFSRTA